MGNEVREVTEQGNLLMQSSVVTMGRFRLYAQSNRKLWKIFGQRSEI